MAVTRAAGTRLQHQPLLQLWHSRHAPFARLARIARNINRTSTGLASLHPGECCE
jgi:hypothetical protein